MCTHWLCCIAYSAADITFLVFAGISHRGANVLFSVLLIVHCELLVPLVALFFLVHVFWTPVGYVMHVPVLVVNMAYMRRGRTRLVRLYGMGSPTLRCL